MQQVREIISMKSSKVAICENLDPRKFSAIQLVIYFYSETCQELWCQSGGTPSALCLREGGRGGRGGREGGRGGREGREGGEGGRGGRERGKGGREGGKGGREGREGGKGGREGREGGREGREGEKEGGMQGGME